MEQMMKVPSGNEGIVPVGEQAHLRDYIRILRKRRVSILSIFICTVIGTVLYVLMQQPVYESKVSLLIDPTGPNVMSKAVEEVYAPIDVNFDYYKTQYEILKTYEIMRETVKRLNLKTHPEFASLSVGKGSWFSGVKNAIVPIVKSFVSSPSAVQSLDPERESERQLVEAFKQHIKISPVLNSRIVRVSVESIDPQLAANAA